MAKKFTSLRVGLDVKKLMDKAVKRVAVETEGEVLGINASLEYVLTKYLGEKDDKKKD